MSFQTFCGQDPNDAVSYQKVLPQFIAANSATTSVVRINNAGAFPLRKPSVNNEALTIVETFSQGKAGFSVDVLPNPSALLPVGVFLDCVGALPYKNGAETGYLIYGGTTTPDGVIEKGVIFKYVPNVASPKDGVWSLLAETESPVAIINSGCQLNPTRADGGEPADGALFVFCGAFTQITPAGGAALPCNNIVQYNSADGLFTAIPIAAGNLASPPAAVFGIPFAMAAAGTFILLGGFANEPIQVGATNYGSIALYNPAAGGTLNFIGGQAGDTIGDFQGEQPFWCSFDAQDRLWIGGNFQSSTIAGVPNTSRFLLCLSLNGTTFGTIVPNIPVIGDGQDGTPVQFISNSYDGSKIVICGGGTFNDSGGSKRTGGFGIIDPTTLAITQPPAFNAAGTADITFGACYIDDANYVVSVVEQAGTGVGLFGAATGGTPTTFALGLMGIEYQGLDWYFEGIAAGKPLSYIAFNYIQTGEIPTADEYNAFSGSFSDAAATSSLILQNGAVFRHISASGAYKDAPTATINTQFATLSLIGDTDANAWDVVGFTGTITFNDAP